MKHIFLPTTYSNKLARRGTTKGITLIEIMIVVAILAILFIIVMSQVGRGSLEKARDAERKDDLHEIKLSFEEYYNDTGCYPPSDVLTQCGSDDTEISPYLGEVPCDPLTAEPYVYVPYPTTHDTCSGYRVYAPMEWDSDPVISELGCEGGCGISDDQIEYSGVMRWNPEDYQYGVSEGVPVGYTEGDSGITSGFCCNPSDDTCGIWEEGGECAGPVFANMNNCTNICPTL